MARDSFGDSRVYSPFGRLERGTRYALAFALVALAAVVHALLSHSAGITVPVSLSFFYLAVVTAAWFGGFGAGMVAALLSALAAYFLLGSQAPPEELSLRLGGFLVVSTGISLLAGALHRQGRQAAAAVSERLRLARELDEERRRLLTLLASVPGVVWESRGGPQGEQRWEFVSDSVERMLGYPIAEWQEPRFWLSLVHPEDRERMLREVAEAYDRGHGVLRYRWVARDGSVVRVEAHATVVRDASGAAAGLRGVALDVSGRYRAEQAVRESEERFRIAANSAPVMIWTCGPDLQCDWFNSPWLTFRGRALEEERGEAWLEGAHPEDAARTRSALATAFAARQPFELEYRMRRHDGEYRWVLAKGVARFNADGSFAGYVASALDITDRKRAEAEHERLLAAAQRARAEAEEAARTKDEFLATLSHELRNPLNAIVGWAHILLQGARGPEETQRGLETIVRNARAQAQLVEDLLDVSRIISGKMRLNFGPTDLVPVVEAAMAAVQPAAEAKEIQLVQELDRTATVLGEHARLQQVVWNLLSNAVKFTPRGGRVGVWVVRDGGHVEVRVSDSGAGIPPEFLPHVFERFRQSEPRPGGKRGGLGLGLAIVRHLVELHGGTVQAESAGEGQGATFSVRLPLAPAVQGEPAAPGDESAAQVSLAGVRVLVVEDDTDARELIERILLEAGARVLALASAKEALQNVAGLRPHVLLSDIEMPEQDGYALLRELRARAPASGGDTPAAALTAYARAEDRQRALAAGFEAHLAKPVEPATLLATVAELAERRRGRRAQGERAG